MGCKPLDDTAHSGHRNIKISGDALVFLRLSMVVSEIAPLYPKIGHYLRGWPFLVVSENIELIQSHNAPQKRVYNQCTLNGSVATGAKQNWGGGANQLNHTGNATACD